MSDKQEVRHVDSEPIEVQPTMVVKRTEPLSVGDTRTQVDHIQRIMKAVMKKGEHYGTIPGCGPKPTLLKPGAEKLGMVFRLIPAYRVEGTDYDGGHREYLVYTTLHHEAGGIAGAGVGICSTGEKKYRKSAPVDVYNTVLKMAKKRSHVDAILTATAASDIFTQDIEDGHSTGGGWTTDNIDMRIRADSSKAIEECRKCGDLGELEKHWNKYQLRAGTWGETYSKVWLKEVNSKKATFTEAGGTEGTD